MLIITFGRASALNAILVCIMHILLFTYVSSNIASNPLQMRLAFLDELKIAAMLEDVFKELGPEKSPEELIVYLESHQQVRQEFDTAFESENQNVAERVLAANPIHVYLLMRRLVEQLPAVQYFLEDNKYKNSNYAEILYDMVDLQNSAHWPNPNDLVESMRSLVRIQFVYQMSTVDLANGIIGRRRTVPRLAAEDCLLISKGMMDRLFFVIRNTSEPEYALAIEWAETALELSVKKLGQENKFAKDVKKYLLALREKHDQHYRATTPGGSPSPFPNEVLFITMIGTNLATTGRELRLQEYKEISQRIGGEYHLRDFFALCRGEKLRLKGIHQEEPHQCRFETRNDPYLFLQPIKLEVLQSSPLQIHIFHDIITDPQIQLMQSSVQNGYKLKISRVEHPTNQSIEIPSAGRTQSIGWLYDKLYPELMQFSRHLDHISGLQVSYLNDPDTYISFVESQDYQVGLYGPGGLYFDHHDYTSSSARLWRNDLFLGDRIATLMFYLSDVEGGRTAFPSVGVSAVPSKGSAVFWYNLHSDGSKDVLTLHGACPVLFGTKWVSNKWIMEGSQFAKRPCLHKAS